MKTGFKTTKIIPDNSQLQVSMERCKCRRCKTDYVGRVTVEMKTPLVKCPYCDHIQVYQSVYKSSNNK